MDENEFIAYLKANNTAKDINDLSKVYGEYKVFLDKLQHKNRAYFALNVLCILCRNLDKAPQWRDNINSKDLLVLTIDCVREVRYMERADRVKSLACIYHIHRHIVKLSKVKSLPPELVLKLSYMAFELDAKNLLHEYAKTYWNIFVDRLTYVEKLRNNISAVKVLPKLTEDIDKLIEINEIVHFCSNSLVVLVKKMHYLYSDKHAKELNESFRNIFTSLSNKDTKPLKKLSEKEIMDIYVKLNDCLYVIAENSSKTHFKHSLLDNIVRMFISIVGHRPDLFHCLQTFYSNGFCSLLKTNTHLTYSETVLNGLIMSLETTEKLGYKKVMLVTYPFLTQFLRLYIEYNVASDKPWKDNFNTLMQEYCLKMMEILMVRLKNCNQLLKCVNCNVKSGLHDSLRLSFLVMHFITVPLSQNMKLTDLIPTLQNIIENQYRILDELNNLGCGNHEKCFKKLQTDVHNTAILLNKAQYYEFSIELFKIYLTNEIRQNQELNQKNISRALYNKSICELDAQMYESALIDAFLSLMYSSDGLSTEKHMSLVVDVKAKELESKSGDDEEAKESLQMFSITDACQVALEKDMYGDISSYVMGLNYSVLLKHEFSMYAKLWPTSSPISGVWASLLQLSKGEYMFTNRDDHATLSLYEVILKTFCSVRVMSNKIFENVTRELLYEIDKPHLDTNTPDMMVMQASLLFLTTEFELATASVKYGWKTDVQSLDPDTPANRTISQEYEATKSAIQAVRILAELSPDFETVSNKLFLRHSLFIYQVFVAQLLYLSRDAEALQLAYMCCLIAECVGDDESFVRNAGVVICRAGSRSLLKRAAAKCPRLLEDRQTMETAIVLMCDAAIYYKRCNEIGNAARLVQIAQTKILDAYHTYADINLDMAVGRVMEAQTRLCKNSGLSVLSAVNCVQRHYLGAPNTGMKWHTHRLNCAWLRCAGARACVRAARAARRLRAWRRARTVAAAAARSAAAARAAAAVLAATLAAEVTDANAFDDAQIKIDNHLKHYLGLQSSNEIQPLSSSESKPQTPFTLKQDIETMLENMVLKKSSPSISCTSVPAFKKPDFFDHDPKCECYSCCLPVCYILALQTSGLEASVYFRANEDQIARNYFNGVLKMFHSVEGKFKSVARKCNEVCEEFIVESVMGQYWKLYRTVKVEILIELTFFELRNGDYDAADGHIVEIHEIFNEMASVDDYLSNEVMNLMTCSAQMRVVLKKPGETGLEAELDGLKLSPLHFAEPPKTPVTKPGMPKPDVKIVVRDEEIPKRRKVIKLNLNEVVSDEKNTKKTKRPEFKVPVPVTTKHNQELATPRVRSQPSILLTQPSQDAATPDAHNKTDLLTPQHCTPEKFFTPLTSVRTYTKKSLRVKNLEQDFLTPCLKNTPARSQDSFEKEPSRSQKKTARSQKEPARSRKETARSQKEPTRSKKETTLSQKEPTLSQKEPETTLSQKEPTLSQKEPARSQKEPTRSQDISEKPMALLELPKRSKAKNEKMTLKRASSPGKLCKEPRELPRSRLRKPVKFSIDEDDSR